MLKSLIEIEIEEDLWHFDIEGNCIWSLIRTELFSYIIQREMGYNHKIHTRGNILNLTSPKYLRELKRTHDFIKNVNKEKFDSFFSTSVRNKKYNMEKNRYYDVLYDPYLCNFSNPLIFEKSYQFKINHPSANEDSTYLSDYLYALRSIGSLKRSRIKSKDKIKEFSELLYSIFNIGDNEFNIHRFLCKELNGRYKYINSIDNVIQKMDGNIAFITQVLI